MAEPKYKNSELDRKDVLDLVRTRERLVARSWLRRRLNVVEAEEMENFDEREAAGKSTRPALGADSGALGLTPGELDK